MKGNFYLIPHHLRDTSYASAKKGNGQGYQYPHDFPNDYVVQQYPPKVMRGIVYYQPKLHSVYEKRINGLYERFTKKGKDNFWKNYLVYFLLVLE
ncbi:MAG: hypothetical protein OHM56_08815 [Spiroplasma phoeniceum]|nr:MAG: hypothetical protein OHM57_08210 [Spiroplasma phoeniceum]UZQ33622.1 MAG: hypothetical protein OHM56_08815 [Spiroplasma phoeniceum]